MKKRGLYQPRSSSLHTSPLLWLGSNQSLFLQVRPWEQTKCALARNEYYIFIGISSNRLLLDYRWEVTAVAAAALLTFFRSFIHLPSSLLTHYSSYTPWRNPDHGFLLPTGATPVAAPFPVNSATTNTIFSYNLVGLRAESIRYRFIHS